MMQYFRRQVVLFVGLIGCLAAIQGGTLLTTARCDVPPVENIQTVRNASGRVLGNVEWDRDRALAQGVAYAPPGVSDESSTYWRAAERARQQGISRLADVVIRAARERRLDTSTERVDRSVERALVIDSDYDAVSGQVTLTLAATLYGPVGALGPSPEARPAFYDLYRRPAPAYTPPPPEAAPVPPDITPVPAPPDITPVPAPSDITLVPTPPVSETQPPPDSAVDAAAGLTGTPVGQVGPFTGVVIDCRGLHLSPSMSPKIRTSDGNEVWGTVHVSHDFAVVTGIAGFMDDWDRARSYQPRVGSHPMILRAIARTGGRYENEAVITDADAAWLKRENENSHFLDQFHVMFVVDPLPGE